MKLLVIRFSSIGDIVLTTPAIRCIKQQIPDVELHFLTKRSFQSVTEANPYIDRFFYYENNLGPLIADLKNEQYDCIIDLHKNFRTYRIRWALGVKTLSYQKLSLQKFLLTKFHLNFMPRRHIVTRCLDAVAPLGVVDDGGGLDYFFPETYRSETTNLPALHQQGYVAMVIGASYFTKKMPVEKFKALCLLINQPIVLVGGKEDRTEGEQIAAVDPNRILNACGSFSLHGSAEIVQKANVVISHDTGLQYIACAFNKRVLAIWGGTSPLLDVEPYYGVKQTTSHSFLFQNFIVPKLSCQPCSNYGTKTCPRGHFKCMNNQDLSGIAGAVVT